MRRAVAILTLCAVVLAGCSAAPAEFDPETGEGHDALVEGFQAKSTEEQLDELAVRDERVERMQWSPALDDELGGADATDEVFDGLMAQLQDSVDVAQSDDSPYTLASFTSNVGEASGAGMFAGMLFSALMSEAGIAATQYGATGDVVKDFGEHGSLTVSAGEDGVVTTGYEVSTTYKGVTITIVVGNQMNPCPDANGVVDASGKYQINVQGPNGAGSSTQIDLRMKIQVDDDAKIASSDYTYDATYMKRPQAADTAIFDLTTESISFRGGTKAADFEKTDESIAGFWSKTFETEAGIMSAIQAAWVASSLEKAAQRGWQDGRCISLTASYSSGPTGLKPDAEVTITAKPVAKRDGTPAGGTVTAELTGGSKSVTPSGTKVKADAAFSYTAPGEKDQTGTVHLESRSKRGVGMLDATLDTKALRAYSAVGGGGDFQGTGTICDITQPFTISGSGVTMQFTPTGSAAGTYSYSGSISGFAVSGGDSYEVTYVDGVATSITGTGVGSVETPNGTVSGYGEENYFLTPLETVPDGC